MFISVMPLFDRWMSVIAYSFRAQKNHNTMVALPTADLMDGATYSLAFDAINSFGLDTLTGGKPIFVPINNIALLMDIHKQCNASPEKIIFVMDNSVESSEKYMNRIILFKELGYQLAIQNVKNYDYYSKILQKMDYIFLDYRHTDVRQAKVFLNTNFPHLKLVVSNIDKVSMFKDVRYEEFCLYEGKFYRLPVIQGANNHVTPLKVNYIQLLNIINDENFEINQVAQVVQQDTALAISLLKMVNNLGLSSEIKTIKHAAALLGQGELRKWITTAVINHLYADKPNEITRLSLIRAKFAEFLAPSFEMDIHEQELFLLGLFSVLDIILEMPFSEAVRIVRVSENIQKALVNNSGKYAPILEFIKTYESADWQEVSRLIIIHNIPGHHLYEAYTESLKWYRNLIFSIQ